MSPEVIVGNILNGLALGMILFMLTGGLSITMGLMGIVNLSHGALYMFGGYVGWTVANTLGANYGLAVLAGGLAAGLIGLAMQRGLLDFMYKLTNEQVVATIGVLYILQNLTLLIWHNQNLSPFTAPLFSGTVPLFRFTYPVSRISIIGIGIAIFFVLWWVLEKTRLGAIIRAGMDDKELTEALGINTRRITYMVFSFGAFMAGIAAVIGVQMLSMYVGMVWDILLLALIVLVVGGVGSIKGALVGALLVGIVDSFGRILFPSLSMSLIYITMIVVLMVRPLGLVPRRG